MTVDFVVRREDFLADVTRYLKENRRVRVVNEKGETTMWFGPLCDSPEEMDPDDKILFEDGRRKERADVLLRISAEIEKLLGKSKTADLIAGCLFSLQEEIFAGAHETKS